MYPLYFAANDAGSDDEQYKYSIFIDNIYSNITRFVILFQYYLYTRHAVQRSFHQKRLKTNKRIKQTLKTVNPLKAVEVTT